MHLDGAFARLDLCLLVLLCQKSRENQSKELTIWRTGSALDCVTFLTKPSAKASAQPVPCVLVTAGAQFSAWVGAIFISSGKCHRLHALGQVLLCLPQFRGELATLSASDLLPTPLRAL